MAGPAPTIYALSPRILPAAGGRVIQVIGKDIDTVTGSVTVGGGAVSPMSKVSTFLIQGVAPAHAAGVVDVVVTTTNGTATAVGAVTYV